MGVIWIVTGPRAAGKTTFCQRIVELAQQRGWQTAGLLSLAHLEGGHKTAIIALDLHSREKFILARQPGNGPVTPGTPGWSFDSAALEHGNRILTGAVPCDLLVVDELGPLELERAEGWTAGLKAVESGKYRLALVVIRPELLNHARQLWPAARVISITHPAHGLVEIPEDILNIFNANTETDEVGRHAST